MSDAKLSALQNLVDTPRDLYKLKIYESKLHSASTTLLFDCRSIILNAVESSKFVDEVSRIIPQLRARIDTLIDRSRRLEIRIRPGTNDRVQKTIFNNGILYDLIIFSRCWDLKITLGDLDSLIVFSEIDKIKTLSRSLLEEFQVIDTLFSQKENITVNIQSSDDIAASLLEQFYQELEFAEKAGALKGIIKLEKPKVLGRGKYYDQLGNIILKIIMSFELDDPSDPISFRAIYTRMNNEFPLVKAEAKDIQKVIDDLADNGVLILKEDKEGLLWVQLQPKEKETNIILQLAQEKGFVTVEELMMITNWSLEESIEEMEKFVTAGLAIKDASYAEGTKYYFPGLN